MGQKQMKYLIDSNILIYHLNGNKVATDFIANIFSESIISRISFIEVLSFDLDENQEKEILKWLLTFEIVDTSEKIALQSIKNRRKCKIKTPDNIIAATAQVNDLILVTRNVKDFKSIDIQIFNIFDD